ncbi:hypothetical protein [Pyruvatibacter sp.]|uniref:hypothetical protein n=1 Tax=Pyruvatibacter sp. TaxID=1981328 RepID=UPI003264B9F0
MKTLLENAAGSIRVGVEDIDSTDAARIVSVVRNIHAGVLLLCKEILVRLSPADSNAVLIRMRTKSVEEPDGSTREVGVGTSTIGRKEIKQRFKDVGVEVDLSILDSLSRIRNDLEHSHFEQPIGAVKGAIGTALPLIVELCKELQEPPRDIFGKSTWDRLLSEKAVFDSARSQSLASLQKWEVASDALRSSFADFQCYECGSGLVAREEDDALKCAGCSSGLETDKVAAAALAVRFEFDEYVSLKDGGEEIIATCPECTTETYVVGENACAICGYSLDGQRCAVCGQSLSVDEVMYGDNGLCSYHQHAAGKD